jgi:hypothetical protein
MLQVGSTYYTCLVLGHPPFAATHVYSVKLISYHIRFVFSSHKINKKCGPSIFIVWIYGKCITGKGFEVHINLIL